MVRLHEPEMGWGLALRGLSLNLDRSSHFGLRLATAGERQERRFQCSGCL